MNAPPTTRPRFPLVAAYGVVVVFAAVYVAFHLATHSAALLEAATGRLLQGETHWITFQNRVLGPALIEGIRLVSGLSWTRSFYLLVGTCSVAAGAIFVHRAWTQGRDPIGGLGAAAAWFLLATACNHPWSYPWDYLGSLLNLLLALWITDRYRTPADLLGWRPMVLLGALMLNRESSLIALASLAAIILLDGARASSWRPALRAAGALAVTAIANVALVMILRHLLFAGSTRPDQTAPVHEMAIGNFLQLRDNLGIFAGETLSVRLMTASLAGGMMLLTGAGLLAGWCQWQKGGPVAPGTAFALCYLILGLAALAVFACASEFRVYYELIPFCLILAGGLADADRRPSVS